MTTKLTREEEKDHLDRFSEVAKGLGLNKLIVKKLANFIHYEVMSIKLKQKSLLSQEIKEERERLFKAIGSIERADKNRSLDYKEGWGRMRSRSLSLLQEDKDHD